MSTVQATKLQAKIDKMHQKIESLILATIDEDGLPYASYAPYVFHEGNYYVFISEIAPHTQHINSNPNVGVMLIKDEGDAKNLFARERVNYQASTTRLDRTDEDAKFVLAELQKKDKKVMEILLELNDFHVYRLVPKQGRVVLGFGKAYLIEDDNQFTQLTDGHLKEARRSA